MSNGPVQQPTVNPTKGVCYGPTYQQQQHQYGGGNYYPTNGPTPSQQAYWSGQATGYGYGADQYNVGAMQQANSMHHRAHWNNVHASSPNKESYAQRTFVSNGNRHQTGKRTYASDAPLHDITNQAFQQPKRRKVATNSSPMVYNNTVQKPAPVYQPQPSSTVDRPRPVRVESIFRNVELLAQSYWQTGGTSASNMKPATVDAFENTVVGPKMV